MKHKTEWTCARCKTTLETEYGTAPENWIVAGFNPQPLGVKSGPAPWKPIDELCDPCGGYMVDFVHGIEQDTIARDKEIREMVDRIAREASNGDTDEDWLR